MKKLTTVVLAAMLVASTSFAFDKGKKHKMKAKEHTCTEACKDGKHMYACGEKGHKCTDECKGHMKKHGEKGHICTDACKKDMKKKM